jgi:ribosome maturation factor RimP
MATVRTAKQELVAEVEASLGEAFPEVEVVDLDVASAGGALTLYIDRPGGVDLDLCAAVTEALEGLRERYALEVSSPGLDRRLRTGAHFAAAVGREVAVKLTTPRDGRSNFRGVVTAADQSRVVLALDAGGSADLPLETVATAHVVYDFEKNGGRRE